MQARSTYTGYFSTNANLYIHATLPHIGVMYSAAHQFTHENTDANGERLVVISTTC